MLNVPIFTYEAYASKLNYNDAVEALYAGHKRPKAEITDMFLGSTATTLLSRGAYVQGLGYGVKSVTIATDNAAQGLPTVQGALLLFTSDTGALSAIIESALVTEYKTAADSVLGATLLARPDSRHLLVVGAGAVARSLIHAYCTVFQEIEQVSIWARRTEQAEALAASFQDLFCPITVQTELAVAASKADIIATATMAREPILCGDWITPGTHIDLVGAFKADMREADDKLMSTGHLFVDCFETTVTHIGELMIPIHSGAISFEDVRADLYGLICGTAPGRQSDKEITVFKNGGGAHLDVMMAHYITSTQ